MSEAAACPNCKANLDGVLIYDSMLAFYGDEIKAMEETEKHGATKTEGRFPRVIYIKDNSPAEFIAYSCPDCGHEWPR